MDQQNPNTPVCGYFFLPNAHSGDVATTLKDLQPVGVQVYKLNSAVTLPGVHRFGNFNQNAPGLPAPPACTSTEMPPVARRRRSRRRRRRSPRR